MTKKEIEKKVWERWRSMSDDEWLELYEECRKIPSTDDFRHSTVFHMVANTRGIIEYKRSTEAP